MGHRGRVGSQEAAGPSGLDGAWAKLGSGMGAKQVGGLGELGGLGGLAWHVLSRIRTVQPL